MHMHVHMHVHMHTVLIPVQDVPDSVRFLAKVRAKN
jgi:hypothetical protein